MDMTLKNKLLAELVKYNEYNDKLSEEELQAAFERIATNAEFAPVQTVKLNNVETEVQIATVAAINEDDDMCIEVIEGVEYEISPVDSIVIAIVNNELVWAKRSALYYSDLTNDYAHSTSHFKDDTLTSITIQPFHGLFHM